MAAVDRVSPGRSSCTRCAAGVPASSVSAIAPIVWCPSLPQPQAVGQWSVAIMSRPVSRNAVLWRVLRCLTGFLLCWRMQCDTERPKDTAEQVWATHEESLRSVPWSAYADSARRTTGTRLHELEQLERLWRHVPLRMPARPGTSPGRQEAYALWTLLTWLLPAKMPESTCKFAAKRGTGRWGRSRRQYATAWRSRMHAWHLRLGWWEGYRARQECWQYSLKFWDPWGSSRKVWCSMWPCCSVWYAYYGSSRFWPYCASYTSCTVVTSVRYSAIHPCHVFQGSWVGRSR